MENYLIIKFLLIVLRALVSEVKRITDHLIPQGSNFKQHTGKVSTRSHGVDKRHPLLPSYFSNDVKV